MKPPERDSSSLSGEDNTCPSSPLGRGSCQADVPPAKALGCQCTLTSPVVTAGVENSQPEQGECLGASATALPSWPRSGEVSTATLSRTPRSHKGPATAGLGRVGRALSSHVEVHHHKVPSIFISPFCHRKAEDFIILTVLHTHQVRLAGPWPAPGGPGQGWKALLETRAGSLQTLETTQAAQLIPWTHIPPTQGSSESCQSPLESLGVQPCPHSCHQEGRRKNIPKATRFAEDIMCV